MKNIIKKKENTKTPKVFILKEYADVDEVIISLRNNEVIIINASKLTPDEGYRVIDFLCGFTYASHGAFKKIDSFIYRFEL